MVFLPKDIQAIIFADPTYADWRSVKHPKTWERCHLEPPTTYFKHFLLWSCCWWKEIQHMSHGMIYKRYKPAVCPNHQQQYDWKKMDSELHGACRLPLFSPTGSAETAHRVNGPQRGFSRTPGGFRHFRLNGLPHNESYGVKGSFCLKGRVMVSKRNASLGRGDGLKDFPYFHPYLGDTDPIWLMFFSNGLK